MPTKIIGNIGGSSDDFIQLNNRIDDLNHRVSLVEIGHPQSIGGNAEIDGKEQPYIDRQLAKIKIELTEHYEPKFIQVLSIMQTVQESMFGNQGSLAETKVDLTKNYAAVETVD